MLTTKTAFNLYFFTWPLKPSEGICMLHKFHTPLPKVGAIKKFL